MLDNNYEHHGEHEEHNVQSFEIFQKAFLGNTQVQLTQVFLNQLVILHT